MTRPGKFLFYWGPVLLYAGLILSLSSLHSVPGGARLPDKPLHCLEYFLFGVLLSRAFLQGASPTPWSIPKILISGALFGALDEFYQSFVPGRFSSAYDWLADVTGIGLAISLLLLRRYKEQTSG